MFEGSIAVFYNREGAVVVMAILAAYRELKVAA